MIELQVNKNTIQDAINLKDGVYAPLTGFMRERDFFSVLNDMRLMDGSVWSMPVVLDIDKETVKQIENEDSIILKNGETKVLLNNIEIYSYDKEETAYQVYGTGDKAHPGVAGIYSMGDYLVGGDIGGIENAEKIFPEHNFTPAETREIFADFGWETVAAFQTRNVPHQGHEFLQKHALNSVDGLLIQPVIGEKKPGDFRDEQIISSYRMLINKFFPPKRAMLGILPLKMRYAGPREAVMHALIRKNYGCTHFIVGRDHAGVGDYYAPLAAQEIFEQFKPDELGIEILKYGEVVYNKKDNTHCFLDECEKNDIINFSGTVLREYFANNEMPPEYLVRREIYEHLLSFKHRNIY